MLASLLTLWLLYVLVMLSPGVNLLLVSQLAASDQARSARWAGLGVATGAGLWASLAALGVAGLLQTQPALRVALALAGGLYLLKLAAGLWTSGLQASACATPALTRAQAYWRGLLTNLSNVKAALFFASVFAGAMPAQADAPWLLAAIALVALTAALWYSLLAHALSRDAVRQAYRRASRGLGRVSALLMAALGLGLLVTAAQTLS